jgi:predicted permease
VTDGFFRTLGVAPILGRDFYTGEDAPGKPHTVMISYAAWQKRFAGSPDVIGQTVKLSDISYTVIGVLPRDFHFAPRDAEFWAALNDPASCELRRGCHSLFGLARLKDDASIATALTAMKSVAQRMEKQYPENRGFSADVLWLSDWITGKIRPVLLVLLGGAALLLLIACVNISSLLLVRSESRKREIAVRSALGASPGRLLRQFVIEGLVLVVAESICGFASAYVAMHLLVKLIPAGMLEYMPYLQGLGLNVRVLAFAGLVTLFAAVLFSITPALRLSSSDVQGDLAEGSQSSSGLLWGRIGSKLVVLELATAVILLACAGLLGKSLYQLLHVSIGFEPDHIATLQITMPQAYSDDKQVLGLERRMVQQIKSLPGVRFVGISTSLPARGWDLAVNIVVTGRPWNGEHNVVPQRNVSADYLRVLGARLIRGRFFTDEEDDPAKPGVVLINQAFARKFFPGEEPVGKRISFEGSHDSMEIIGLLEDIKEGQLDTEDLAAIYQPFSQGWFRTFHLAVRTSQAERPMLPTLIATIHRIDPDIATSYAMTMTDLIDDSLSAYLHRFAAWIVRGFAAIALLLGIVGLYGVIAYSVGQRTREIGVRIALGAQRITVYRLIVGEASLLIVSGLVIGLGLSIGVAVLMRSLLFQVRAWDAPTLGAVALLLAGSALLASFLPARRAASVNPVEALRSE